MAFKMGGRILVDMKGKFSWTEWVNSFRHFCPWELLFLGEFLYTFFGCILVDIFGEFSWILCIDSNDKSYNIIKQ